MRRAILLVGLTVATLGWTQEASAGLFRKKSHCPALTVIRLIHTDLFHRMRTVHPQ